MTYRNLGWQAARWPAESCPYNTPARRQPFDGVTLQLVSSAAPEPPLLPPASEAAVRAHSHALSKLAAQFGITQLRFASDGRLVGRVAEARDALDVAEFEVAARQLLEADVGLFSDRVLTKPNVSPDLVASRPL